MQINITFKNLEYINYGVVNFAIVIIYKEFEIGNSFGLILQYYINDNRLEEYNS